MVGLPRRGRIALVAATVVAVLAATVIVLREDVGPPPAETAQPEARTPPRISVRGVDFADDRRWFALRETCHTDRDERCAYELSEFDGQRLQPRELPAELRAEQTQLHVELSVLGPDRLTVDAYPVRLEHARRWFTADGGRNWTRADKEADPVGEIPAGAQLRAGCLTEPACHRADVLLPDSGRLAALRTLPPLTEIWPIRFPDAAGRWRVLGRGNGQAVLATSTDSGRTWGLARLPAVPPGRLFRPELATAGGQDYLQIAVGPANPGDPAATVLFRDGAKGWELIRQGGPDSPDPSQMLGLAGSPDGRLTVGGVTHVLWRSEDGGRTFHNFPLSERDPTPVKGWLHRGSRGYFAVDGATVLHSPDGAHWSQLPTG